MLEIPKKYKSLEYFMILTGEIFLLFGELMRPIKEIGKVIGRSVDLSRGMNGEKIIFLH
jgi:hypothetical protein